MKKNLTYPSGKEFAFTILDDTDDTTVKNGRPVYDFLYDLGLRTTKTVWAFDTPLNNRGPYFAGETLSSPEYLEWVHELANREFELAFHNATMGSSLRKDTIKALNFINKEFGQRVRIHCNHGQNIENLHWGKDRYGSYTIRKLLYFISMFHSYTKFEGNDPESPYYWSDVADKQLSYIRAFTFRNLNCEKNLPGRPFHDSTKQNGPVFFNTTDFSDVSVFNKFVTIDSINKLHQEKGWTIVSTHFGKGFFKNNKLNTEFKHTMEHLASLPGWFVPASQLLDFISIEKGSHEISKIEKAGMELSHIADRISGKVFNSSMY
jgi:hypothetical protein